MWGVLSQVCLELLSSLRSVGSRAAGDRAILHADEVLRQCRRSKRRSPARRRLPVSAAQAANSSAVPGHQLSPGPPLDSFQSLCSNSVSPSIRRAVHGGQQLALGTNDRIKLFADQCFRLAGASHGLGRVTLVEDELLRRRHIWRDAGLLQSEKLGAGWYFEAPIIAGASEAVKR